MRYLKWLLPLFLLLFVVTACTSGNQTNPNPTPQTPQPNPTTPTPTPTVKEKEVVLIFTDMELLGQYKETRTIKYEKEEDLPKLALEEWQKGPTNPKLKTLIPKNVEFQSITKENGGAVVSFSPEIKNANLGSTGEGFLLEEAATILSQFGYKNTKFLIDGKEVETILGHMDATKPVNPLDISKIKEMTD